MDTIKTTSRETGTRKKGTRFESCPRCGHDWSVIGPGKNVVVLPGRKLRFRTCTQCGHVFQTEERIT